MSGVKTSQKTLRPLIAVTRYLENIDKGVSVSNIMLENNNPMFVKNGEITELGRELLEGVRKYMPFVLKRDGLSYE